MRVGAGGCAQKAGDPGLSPCDFFVSWTAFPLNKLLTNIHVTVVLGHRVATRHRRIQLTRWPDGEMRAPVLPLSPSMEGISCFILETF